jgi:hypothetical protein
MTDEAGPFFQDETKLETNPIVGFCWMRKAKQRPLCTPGTNCKVWVSGHSTSPQGDSTGWSGSAKTTICSSGYSSSYK